MLGVDYSTVRQKSKILRDRMRGNRKLKQVIWSDRGETVTIKYLTPHIDVGTHYSTVSRLINGKNKKRVK